MWKGSISACSVRKYSSSTQPHSPAWKDVYTGDEHRKEKKEEKWGEYEVSASLHLHENTHFSCLLYLEIPNARLPDPQLTSWGWVWDVQLQITYRSEGGGRTNPPTWSPNSIKYLSLPPTLQSMMDWKKPVVSGRLQASIQIFTTKAYPGEFYFSHGLKMDIEFILKIVTSYCAVKKYTSINTSFLYVENSLKSWVR